MKKEYLHIAYEIENLPSLDPSFIPMGAWMRAYLSEAERPLAIAIERENGKVSVFETKLRRETETEANFRYLERYVKFLLWCVGGFKVYIAGDDALTARLQTLYTKEGPRAFDVQFMEDVYERPLTIAACSKEALPKQNENAVPVGGHTNGCRIGFDAGGSDRKVSAVIDGETVYSEEVVWFPKTASDPAYQYEGILSALRTAASKMPRVDGIGVSSAGVFVGNQPAVSSLFIQVPRERRSEVRTIYERAAAQIGKVPLVVANDGDVTALAGSMSMGKNALMGLAMGTSEAVGYVNAEGSILGWFNELAFAPVDLNENAIRDEWSTDIGVGCKYFSQDAVIKLAPAAGIALEESLSPAEKLKAVQSLVRQGSEPAKEIFRSIGVYLAHTLSLYAMFYDLRSLLVLGRVASGLGGELIVEACRDVLRKEYSALAETLSVTLPNEQFRRVGQSMAAASLPEV